MKVVILAGGLGTRLRPVLADQPKSLAPVAGRPLACSLTMQPSFFVGRRKGGMAEHLSHSEDNRQ